MFNYEDNGNVRILMLVTYLIIEDCRIGIVEIDMLFWVVWDYLVYYSLSNGVQFHQFSDFFVLVFFMDFFVVCMLCNFWV